MPGNVEITVRSATPVERVVQNNDGTFSRSMRNVAPAGAAPPIPTTREVVEVGGGNPLLEAAKARAASQAAKQAQRAGGEAKPAGATSSPTAPNPPTEAAKAPPAGANSTSEDAALAAMNGEKPAAPAEKPAEPAATPPPAPVAEQPSADQIAEWKAVMGRQAQLLEQASGEIQRLTKGQADEVKARVERLQAAEDSYLDSPAAAVRHLVVTALGLDEKSTAEIDSEMDDLIRDLIAARHPSTVQIDEAQRANRQSALIKRTLARDRQRADGQRRDSEVQQQRRQAELADDTDRQIIAKHLASNTQSHPHLRSLAGPLDGATPEAKVLEAIKVGISTGHFDPNTPPARLMEMGAELAEKHYRARLEAIQKARPNNDTAAPSPPPAQPAGAANVNVKEGTARQSHGSRTITNADASVAPTGAVETPTETKSTKPETSEERLRRVMKKHGVKTRY